MRTLLLVVVIVVVAGCSMLPPTANPEATMPPGAITVLLPSVGHLPALPVGVVDHAGLVKTADPAVPADPPVTSTEVDAVPGHDDQVRLNWMGGACDVLTTVTIDELGTSGRYQVLVGTRVSGGVCPAVGIFRSILLTFVKPVDPSSLSVS